VANRIAPLVGIMSFFRRRVLSVYCLISRSVLSRNYAVGMNGDRSRLGCCSVRFAPNTGANEHTKQ
jgi:hypothetical protein